MPPGPTFTSRLRAPDEAHGQEVWGLASKEATTEAVRPAASARPSPLPQGPGYALKRAVLGPALPTARLKHERLGKPTALAVFASDNLSSSAYATEEILKVAVPAVGGAAFALVMPITFAILAVLAILLFSYRQTIKAYPSAGGAYIVTRDNFGLLPAQVAGVALLTDYVLTVSVSVAAGIAAITSAAGSLYPYRVWMSVFCIWFITWGNLRGVRESGRMFAVPTYFFIVMMFVLLGVGMYRALGGDLHPVAVPDDSLRTSGAVGIFLILHAFASGGAAVTGVEAVSNGIPAFKPPEWKNARTTLMWMGTLLGIMFLGLSYLAVQLRVVPTETKTLNSQVARAVFGGGAVGTALFVMIQIATTLILILAANTSFADFPRLANFHATDNFMPRQLTKRGHRLFGSGFDVARRALPGGCPPADPSLCDRRLHVVHPFAGRHGSEAPPHQGARVAPRPRDKRFRGDHDGRGHGDHRGDEVRARCLGGDGVRAGHGVAARPVEPPVRTGAPGARRGSPAVRCLDCSSPDRRPSGQGPRPRDGPRAAVRQDHQGRADACGPFRT